MKKVSISESDLKIVVEALETGKISMADILFLINNKDDADEITLTIDYSRTLQEMISAGNYHWTNSDVTERNFPLPAKLNSKKTLSARLFHFSRVMSSKDIINVMRELNYRPATLFELLALGETYPKLQKEFPIVTLSSFMCGNDGIYTVPVLGFPGGERRLALRFLYGDWSVFFRFLAIRK